jgi:hypothetical protein
MVRKFQQEDYDQFSNERILRMPRTKQKEGNVAVAEAAPVDESVPDTSPLLMRPGAIVMPMDPIPRGWQKIPMDNGTMEAWPIPEQMWGEIPFDQEIRRKTLKKVDEEWDKMVPTREFPDKPAPALMLVNPQWRSLFREVQSWGDDCPIMLINDKRRLPGSGPQFKFIPSDKAPQVLESMSEPVMPGNTGNGSKN